MRKTILKQEQLRANGSVNPQASTVSLGIVLANSILTELYGEKK